MPVFDLIKFGRMSIIIVIRRDLILRVRFWGEKWSL